AGNDILFGGYDLEVDTLVAGSGNDTVVWQHNDKAYGGEGVDTLTLVGNIGLFDSDDAALVNGFEVITMEDRSTDWLNSPTSLKLDANDILKVTGGEGHLSVFGDSADSLLLVDSDGAGGYQWIHFINSAGQNVYSWSGDPAIQVVVDAETQVQMNLYT